MSLSDSISNHLSELDLNKKYINLDASIEELLTHRSGINDYTESSSIIYANPFSTTDEWNAKTILSLIEKPASNRGEFIYSSANYIILGLIVEKVSGISLNNYLREKFKLLIALGFHYFVHWGKLTVTGIQAKLQQFGLGIGENVQAEFHFTERVYLPLGLLFAWDFFGSSHTKAGNTVITADSGFAKWFIVQPRIGIGFHF